MNRILVCISDAELFLFFRHVLANEGLRAIAAPERKDLFEQPDLQNFKAIIFEWDRGQLSKEGIDFVKMAAPDVPLIILSRDDQNPEEFARHKDLLLTRPFDPSSLVYFVRRLRHNVTVGPWNGLSRSTVRFSGLELNSQTMQVTRNGKPVGLTSLQFRILGHMMTRGTEVCDRDELIAICWPQQKDVEPRTVDIHIGHLRKALMRYGPDIIRTIRGKGYALKTPRD